MIDQAATNAEFRDIEEMVRAAGNYVDVSDDLRPRTLEEAREESLETSTRFWIAALAMLVVCFAISAGNSRGRLSITPPLNASVSANCDQLHAVALRKSAQAKVDPSWSLVDAYRELRQRQSSLIADAF